MIVLVHALHLSRMRWWCLNLQDRNSFPSREFNSWIQQLPWLLTMLRASHPNPLCTTIVFLKLRIPHKISNYGWGNASAHQFHLIVRLPVKVFYWFGNLGTCLQWLKFSLLALKTMVLKCKSYTYLFPIPFFHTTMNAHPQIHTNNGCKHLIMIHFKRRKFFFTLWTPQSEVWA